MVRESSWRNRYTGGMLLRVLWLLHQWRHLRTGTVIGAEGGENVNVLPLLYQGIILLKNITLNLTGLLILCKTHTYYHSKALEHQVSISITVLCGCVVFSQSSSTLAFKFIL